MLTEITQIWTHASVWLATHAVVPMQQALPIPGSLVDIAEAGMITGLQICIIALVFRPLESLFPAEQWSDRKLTRIDRLYTLIMLLGLFPLFSYLVLAPFGHLLGSSDTVESTFNLKHWLPWFQQHPFWLLAFYYLVYDFVYYWMHRAEHLIPWWWALHSMHHSQRQMSCWTNDRGSYLDGVIQSFILASVGVAMGIDIADFAWLTLASELVQNFSHTNVRFGFGPVLEKIFVDPRFHRHHHMVVDPQRPNLHNCNFGQMFSVWDILFGTALYGEPVRATGVNDPAVDADNERGLIAMQWHTLKRFWGAFRRPAGWRPGDVGFGPDYEPIPVSQLVPTSAPAP